MGTTLELHSEVKIDGKWHHYACVNLRKNYRLFAKMAGIRNEPEWGIRPLDFCTGMRDDATELTKLGWEHQPLVRNEVRVLDCAEIEKLTDWYQLFFDGQYLEDLVGYLFRNAWYAQTQMGVEDCRFIFWET